MRSAIVIWLVLTLVVALAMTESFVIERLWRDHRRMRREIEDLLDQVDQVAGAVDQQLLTQDQIDDRIKPLNAALRESNDVLVETIDSLVASVREAKAERRRLRDLIATTATSPELESGEEFSPVAPPANDVEPCERAGHRSPAASDRRGS